MPELLAVQAALPGTARWCSVCGEDEGNQWFKAGRCDTKGGEDP